MLRRPTPQLIRARKYEIKRRYERQAKLSRRGRSMAAIRISELTRWLDDTFGAGVELVANQHSELIARIMAHHFLCLPEGPRRLSAWFERYTPWIEVRDREYLIGEATHHSLKWGADKLAWKIRLTDAKRTELKITTIGAIDFGKKQRESRRKKRDAVQAKIRRNRQSTILRRHHIGLYIC